jgi:tRNA G18 (ribose-2'-O)-methylase SpoU
LVKVGKQRHAVALYFCVPGVSPANCHEQRISQSTGPAPAVILVNPQLGENIGTAARAMANFGLSEMHIVDPRDGWPSERAIKAASGALTG